ncbi:MAG: Hsp70 family protein [Gammaproteobacteria bacterium]|nr:Hsp70 family protein [Gammaproteobacteria bacterium]
MSAICGIDFGTSNSTIGVIDHGQPRLLPLEGNELTLPSALFFNFEENHTRFGRAAIEDYIEGEYGRLMRSLKSILGSSLMLKSTQIKHRQLNYQQIIAEFIGEMKQRAEWQLNAPLDYVVAGRPVHFVDGDKTADDAAQATLETIYRDAGFKGVAFQFEPIAAALNYEQQLQKEALALIVDIGGGTSDFTIIRLSPENQNRADRVDDILATGGVHIGGNDFDRRFNLATAMPALGMNSHMKGASRLKLPSAPYFNLATWHLIHHQYDPRNIHQMEQFRLHCEQPQLIDRLVRLLKNQDGHRLIGKVEACKIRLANQLETKLDLSFIEQSLSLTCQRSEFDEATQTEVNGISETIKASLQSAQLKPEQINSVFLTGGTTGLPSVRHAVQAIFNHCEIVEGDRFGSVGLGLTLDAQRRFK